MLRLAPSLLRQSSRLLRPAVRPAPSCLSLRPLPSTLKRRYATAVASAPDPNDSFLSGNTANYIDEMYMQWKEDPKSVHISWQVYFKNMESGDMPMSQAFTPPPTIVPSPTGGVAGFMPGMGMAAGEGSDVTNHLKVQLLVRLQQPQGITSRTLPIHREGSRYRIYTWSWHSATLQEGRPGKDDSAGYHCSLRENLLRLLWN
jgi:2-oxoglutarate dehydrogenase E1 component